MGGSSLVYLVFSLLFNLYQFLMFKEVVAPHLIHSNKENKTQNSSVHSFFINTRYTQSQKSESIFSNDPERILAEYLECNHGINRILGNK